MKTISQIAAICCSLAIAALCAESRENFILKAEWPEQNLEGNTIHKFRVPRGGTFDLVAVLGPLKHPPRRFGPAQPRNNQSSERRRRWRRRRASWTVGIYAKPDIKPLEILINGKSHPLDSAITVNRDSLKHEIRWRYRFEWITRKAEPFHDFTVSVRPRRRDHFPVFRKTTRVEQGVSCHGTTMLDRIKEMEKTGYCKYEVTGKTHYGKPMYLVRVTDFSVPAKKKKQMLLCGPVDGEEPTGQESVLDFAWEMINVPENRANLKKVALYIVPSDNPDGHEAAIRERFGYPENMDPEEADAFEKGLDKYKKEYTDPIGFVNHQWGREWTLLSAVAKPTDKPQKLPFMRLTRNITYALMNESDEPIWPHYAPFRGKYYYAANKIPYIIIETAGGRDFNLGSTMPNIVRELKLYHLALQQHLKPTDVKPKPRPSQQISFADSQNYRVTMVKKAPVMDGELNDACWQGNTIISKFANRDWSRWRSRRLKTGTEIRMVYDKKNLYVAGTVPDFAAIDSLDLTTPNWEKADLVQLFFDTNLDRWSHYCFAAYANEVLDEAYFPAGGVEDADTFRLRRHEFKVSIKSGTFELKVPFVAFNRNPEMNNPKIESPPKPGAVWGFNAIRHKNSRDARQSWSPSTGYHGNAPHLFWGMTFTGQK